MIVTILCCVIIALQIHVIINQEKREKEIKRIKDLWYDRFGENID